MDKPHPLMSSVTRRIVTAMALIFVIVGMVNSTPSIPGWDQLWISVTGWDWLVVRRFPYEYYYPIAFAWMMIIVVLWHSVQRAWADRGPLQRRLGLALDITLVIAALAVALTYLIENEAVCLVDVITGERASFIERALQAEREVALALGLPAPSSIDDPRCFATTGPWITLIVGLGVIVFLGYNAQVWGLSLVLVSIALALYAIATVVIWYVFGSEGMNRYLITALGGEPRSLADGRYRVQDLLVNQGSGLLGQFLHIMLNTVFPYIVLGSLLSVSAGGRALIKLAVVSTRKLRGGAAHAAIVASAMFGTTTGTPVVNVLGTGTITIPMMLSRGFSRNYAAGVEAAASSGGQIMPPIMGIAAFVLASMTGVPYREVAIAAALPAAAYFICMFLSVLFQSRKQGIAAVGDVPPEFRLTRHDGLLLSQIFVPLSLIILLLLIPKDAVGCDPISRVLGAVTVLTPSGLCRAEDLPWIMQLIQNSLGDAGSVGWWAAIVLMVMLFIDPAFRQAPGKLLTALAHAGITSAGLYLMFLAVSVIDISLSLTALPSFIALDILGWLRALDLGNGAPLLFQFVALAVTMVLAILMGMGMPAVPAYVNAALLMGPLLVGLGLAHFTAHMFIFYFACVSAITPPVAVASYAASTIARGDPLGASFSAVRTGIVMFVIPFVFAFNPELLLIPAAVLNPAASSGGEQYLPGYDGTLDLAALCWLLVRLALALYLLSSALARFDRALLSLGWVIMRITLAALMMSGTIYVQLPAVGFGFLVLVVHRWQSRLLAVESAERG